MSRRDGMVYSKGGRWYPRVVRHLAVDKEWIEHEDYIDGGYYDVISLCGQRVPADAEHKYRLAENDVTCVKCIKKGSLNPAVQNRRNPRGYSK